RSKKQCNRADEQIHDALKEKAKSGNRLAVEFKHWNGADVIPAGADGKPAIKIGHHFYADALTARFQHDSYNQIATDGRREINLVNKVFGKDARQVIRSAEAVRPGAGFPVHKAAKSFSQVRVAL